MNHTSIINKFILKIIYFKFIIFKIILIKMQLVLKISNEFLGLLDYIIILRKNSEKHKIILFLIVLFNKKKFKN